MAGAELRPPFSCCVLLLSRNFWTSVRAHITTKVFDRVDQDLDDVFRVVNERTRILLAVLIVEGSLDQAGCPRGVLQIGRAHV